MSDLFRSLVAQNTPPAAADGSQWWPRLNRRAEIIVPDWQIQMAIEGRVFEVSNPVKGTAVAMGGTSYSDTAPAFLIDVPAATTMIPLVVNFRQAGTVAGGVITVNITVDSKLRFSAGGTAQTIRNNRTDAPLSSNCSAYSGGGAITALALGIHRTIWSSFLSPDVSPTADIEFPGFSNCVDWTAHKYLPPVLVGPASLVIYAWAAATQPSWFYTIQWLEMVSALVI